MMTPVVSKGNLRTECCRNKSENLERSFFLKKRKLYCSLLFFLFFLLVCLFVLGGWGGGGCTTKQHMCQMIPLKIQKEPAAQTMSKDSFQSLINRRPAS